MSIRVKYYLSVFLRNLLVAAVVFAAFGNLIYEDLAIYLSDTREYIYADTSEVLININTASVRELQKIDGIGRVRAEAIVSYREEHGSFRTVDELINISGIGAATLEKLRPQVTV